MNEKLNQNLLLSIWSQALGSVRPSEWLKSVPSRYLEDADASLFWGKAAGATYFKVFPKRVSQHPVLIISSEPDPGVRVGVWVQGAHPVPDSRSFEAGSALLEFFDSLRRFHIRHLNIYLSGGASSLAWVPDPHLKRAELLNRLEALYRSGKNIRDLNRERAHLCALKGGGAGELLRKLAPDVHARVFIVSDVQPYGPEVVGSGPFWGRETPHYVMADNRKLVEAVVAQAVERGLSESGSSFGVGGPWTEWVKKISLRVDDALARSKPLFWVLGGEPQINLNVKIKGHGGRQTQIAAALALRYLDELSQGRVEFLCVTSDGVDGKSRASGALLNQRVARRLIACGRSHSRQRLRRGISRFDSASVLRGCGALLAQRPTGTNVQDAVLVRVI